MTAPHLQRSGVTGERGIAGGAPPTAIFLVSWAFLNLVVNLRYPAADAGSWLWALLPSLDVTALLLGFVVLGRVGRRVPRWGLWLLTLGLVAVRLFRVGDALVRDGWRRPINLLLDLPLVPDLARLLRSTVPPWKLTVGVLVGVTVAGLMIALIYLALVRVERHLAGTRGKWAGADFALVTAAAAGLSLVLSPPTPAGDHRGLFGASVVPRLAEQVRFVTEARTLRESKAREIAAQQVHLAQVPSGLEKLAGTDVVLFFVESYGHTVFTNPKHERLITPIHQRFADQVARLGMTVATGQLSAPVQGGGSWMAHATFAAGVRIGDGLEFAVLRQTDPPPATMAVFFRRAGYRTVLVQPGTTRPWPEGEVTGFDRRYYAPDLGYRGPTFDWAPMADQYVIDFIGRREITPGTRPPVFAQFALVSSHAPWSVHPPIVDWEKLHAGDIYNQVPPVRFPVTWQTLAQAGDAYISSLGYDFEVIAQFLPRLARPDSLVVILGDHQPHAAVTAAPPAPEVPVHVVSRNRALVEAFLADARQPAASRFVPGMRPQVGTVAPKMETFLAELLRRLSLPRGSAAVATPPSAKTATP
ncbi:MAG TPA: sulfatase-like hydrolase/transferase [Polyangia bacterium]